MPDITMCEGGECPMKNTCWRFKAPLDKYRQSYFLDLPVKDGECKYYWKLPYDSTTSKTT